MAEAANDSKNEPKCGRMHPMSRPSTWPVVSVLLSESSRPSGASGPPEAPPAPPEILEATVATEPTAPYGLAMAHLLMT